MWRGIELYDQAASLARAISALEVFVAERPDDPLAPDAYLRLGQAYHAEGLFDKAISAYRQCQFRYGNTLAAAKSLVPLARAYIAKGPESYARAEETLRSVVENNPQITPEAQEFREALLELAQLHYGTARYEGAIARLEELTARYPDDERTGQMLFLMADSYRRSALLLDEQLKQPDSAPTTRPAADLLAVKEARAQRLAQARTLYDRVIEHYRAARQPMRDIDRLYMKLSHFYRADCVNDLGNYVEAIRLYDDAAFRYQDDPSALSAYVQIVNANVALGRLDEARAANERAKWLLRRMPHEVFESSALAMRKKDWEQWLRWTGDAGLWK
jgi:tetratricopeptide (TPR) repeat protein